ncbi:MAG: small multi-drug export protein [Patescibacteria group bacterium]
MIVEALFSWASSVPPWLATIVLSALPVTEAQLAIPVAVLSWKIHPALVYALAMFGNALPIVPIFFGFTALRSWAERYAQWSVKWLDRLVARAHRKFGADFDKYGVLGLIAFMAIPFPGTGVWTAVLAAVALKLPWRQAIPAIFCGMLLVGAIVITITLAGGSIVR